MALGDTLPGLSAAQLNSEMDGMSQLGVSWIRIDMAWPDVQPADATHYDWSGLDRVVAAANKRNIKILAILDYTPAWARQSSCSGGQKCAPASDSQFATYAAAAVKRYAPQHVQAWEIWNEPNLQGSWRPTPNAANYTALLEASYKAIKQAEPVATVVSGGLGPLDNLPGSIDQLTFLRSMYASGAKPYFDAVGYHPYSYPALPSYTINWNSWATMAALPDSVRSIMTSNGDGSKEIWITEYGAPTSGPGALATTANQNFVAGPDHVDEALQAEMVTEATGQYKATPWLGGFFWYSYQDLGTSNNTIENFFGLVRHDGTHKPAYDVYRRAITTK